MLHLKNVTKKFGARTVLDIPEWALETGAYWIQGENGAGKSTLFHVIAGIFSFGGEIVLGNRYSIREHPVAYRSRVTFAEAEPVYPSFLTPSDLLKYTVKMRKAHETQLHDLTDRMGIGSYLDQPFGQCSSGMVKKVSLTLAFIGNPKLIILDEPLITIDEEARSALSRLIKVRQQSGTGFLLSSHQAFSDREFDLSGIFHLTRGSLQQPGTPLS